jgi:hypothetical protein
MIIEEELDHLLPFIKLLNQLKLHMKLNPPYYELILLVLLETPLQVFQYLLTHLFLFELIILLNYFLLIL